MSKLDNYRKNQYNKHQKRTKRFGHKCQNERQKASEMNMEAQIKEKADEDHKNIKRGSVKNIK